MQFKSFLIYQNNVFSSRTTKRILLYSKTVLFLQVQIQIERRILYIF